MVLCVCRGQRREETFENVLRNPLTFPSKPAISSEAQDLISKLLVKDPVQRLGTKVRASGFAYVVGSYVKCEGTAVQQRALEQVSSLDRLRVGWLKRCKEQCF
jgi:hypothetical protein